MAQAATGNGDASVSAGLQLEGLVIARGGRQVVHAVDLTVSPASVTVLLGANGAGKSSIVHAIGGLLRPVAGRIRLGQLELTGLRPEQVRRSRVAIVVEGRRLLRSMTASDNLAVACHGLPRPEAARRTARVLELFPELHKRLEVPTRLLSGGEQQMVAVAQGLMSDPKVLVIDELSLGLAPVVVKRLLRTLSEIAATGVGILLIEQFAHLALSIAKSASVLSGGRICYQGCAARLARAPELLRAAYLA